jgi:hypothetical protein
MAEMSTDDLDALAKQITASSNPGKWKFDKEHRFLFIDKLWADRFSASLFLR